MIKMRSINVTFEDREFEDLSEVKGEKTWREFILTLLDNKKIKREEKQDK